ncbi:hypothetical protein [Candidatus Epulonipiscium viviparus]|uniref:hypothetical protein n=1 Tax=Candidatus Epulonipiscium viviparus TaxID=420336 RepID=UPI0027380509|nr:hypothetical protein [Candidatus Epulopiscium viviparus]
MQSIDTMLTIIYGIFDSYLYTLILAMLPILIQLLLFRQNSKQVDHWFIVILNCLNFITLIFVIEQSHVYAHWFWEAVYVYGCAILFLVPCNSLLYLRKRKERHLARQQADDAIDELDVKYVANEV